MKTNQQIAIEVIAGKWGNGSERTSRLTQAGYDAGAVQSIVNSLMGDGTPNLEVAVQGKETLEVEIDLNKYNSLNLTFKFGDEDA